MLSLCMVSDRVCMCVCVCTSSEKTALIPRLCLCTPVSDAGDWWTTYSMEPESGANAGARAEAIAIAVAVETTNDNLDWRCSSRTSLFESW